MIFNVSGADDPVLVDVPTPAVPLTPGHTWGAATNWGTYAPERREYLSIAWVDVQGNLSPYSEPLIMNLRQAGGYAIRLTDQVPGNPNIRGVVLRINGNLGFICEGGTGPGSMPWITRPWMTPVRPDWCTDIRMSPEAAPSGGTSSTLIQAPPKPIVRRWNVPNVDLPVWYVWEAESGDTDASPRCISPKIASLPETAMTHRSFYCPGVQVPVGARGYKVYCEINGQTKLLGRFEIDNMQPQTAAARIPIAQSLISPLQQAMDAANPDDTVVVDGEIVTRVPILDRYGEGNDRAGVVITGAHGGKWALRTEGLNWQAPAILVQNQFSEWRGVRISGDASAGFAWSDFSGGQGFGTRIKDFRITLDQSKDTTGIRLQREAASTMLGHTASELYLENGKIAAARPLHIAGEQSANIVLEQMHLYADWYRRRGTCPIYLDTENQVTLGRGCFADFGYAFAYLGMRANLVIDRPWVDQGYEVFLEQFSHYQAQASISGGKFNCWSRPPMDLGGAVPWFARGNFSNITLDGIKGQSNHTEPGFFLHSDCTAANMSITNCPQLKEWLTQPAQPPSLLRRMAKSVMGAIRKLKPKRSL